ncbi:hypothetical protein [uncultured Desulfovibrio sp.]|uniref:hypothetical protein n=1 Tax=uncultured Desulfovibrio sp. TaxID=167968 RepID=UPI00266EC4FE|nr:hypothetical protein [uncultured Desulfovibrio sp.]
MFQLHVFAILQDNGVRAVVGGCQCVSRKDGQAKKDSRRQFFAHVHGAPVLQVNWKKIAFFAERLSRLPGAEGYGKYLYQIR